ncbi:AAA family ATPase [Xanthocytophaga agilis]|nr:AAA family ATPase [Xanthocytophaga agilis]
MEKLLSFLSQPTSYPHQPVSVKVKQTHASVVVIASPYVFKAKKSVNLGFLDFTSPSKRKQDLEREIRLNSRLCAHLYTGIVPIRLINNQLSFGQKEDSQDVDSQAEEIVEYVLQMQELADGYFLNQLLKENKVSVATLEPVLDILEQFYQHQPADSAITQYGDLVKIKEAVYANLDSLENPDSVYSLDSIPNPNDEKKSVEKKSTLVLQLLRWYNETFFEQHQQLFKKRVEQGWIKDCHGDLHLEHIHIYHKKISIYDCIEFNDSFRYIDITADIGFLAMDLDFHNRPDLSKYVTAQMAKRLNDPDMTLLIDFYKCYRACVRAKVEHIRSLESEIPTEQQQKSRQRVAKYLSLALQYLTVETTPSVIIICGRIGTGKSTIARQVALLLGYEYINSDVVRKQTVGLPLLQRPHTNDGEKLYSQSSTENVYQALQQNTLLHIANQTGIVVDATFGQQKHRQEFQQALKKQNIPYIFIEVQASDKIIKERLTQREKQTDVISDARLSDFDLISSNYQPPIELMYPNLITLSTEDTPEHTLYSLFSSLSCRKYSFSQVSFL